MRNSSAINEFGFWLERPRKCVLIPCRCRNSKTLHVVSLASFALSVIRSCLAPSPAVISFLLWMMTRAGKVGSLHMIFVLPSLSLVGTVMSASIVTTKIQMYTNQKTPSNGARKLRQPNSTNDRECNKRSKYRNKDHTSG